jgi:hypothetical protein
MGLVTNIKHQRLEKESRHYEVECTYDVITDSRGNSSLQLDTYGSQHRKLKGKKSQSIRLSPEAIAQLKALIEKHRL